MSALFLVLSAIASGWSKAPIFESIKQRMASDVIAMYRDLYIYSQNGNSGEVNKHVPDDAQLIVAPSVGAPPLNPVRALRESFAVHDVVPRNASWPDQGFTPPTIGTAEPRITVRGKIFRTTEILEIADEWRIELGPAGRGYYISKRSISARTPRS
jgi:hypothetical protein